MDVCPSLSSCVYSSEVLVDTSVPKYFGSGKWSKSHSGSEVAKRTVSGYQRAARPRTWQEYPTNVLNHRATLIMLVPVLTSAGCVLCILR